MHRIGESLAESVFWLPPANDSQGLQLDALRERGLAPFMADWHDILPGRAPIAYGGPEPEVIAAIADAIRSATREPSAAERLRALFLRAHGAPATHNPLSALLDRFGAGGDRVVTDLFVQRLLTPLALSDSNRLRP